VYFRPAQGTGFPLNLCTVTCNQMESCREDLARDEDFDPHTAFKCLDHFKHNRVIAYELHSFFDLHRIPSTIEECEIVIQAIDKSLS